MQSDVKKIIQIFDLHPLNTTKHLDYLNWWEVFIFYTNAKHASFKLKKKIKQNIKF